MYDTAELKRELDKAKSHYQEALTNLENSKQDGNSLSSAAQRANDAWIEYKKVEQAITNCLIIKKLGDLYGC